MPQPREPYCAPAPPETISSIPAAAVTIEFAGGSNDEFFKGSLP